MEEAQNTPQKASIVERVLSPEEIRAVKIREAETAERDRVRTLSGRVRQVIEENGIIETTFDSRENI